MDVDEEGADAVRQHLRHAGLVMGEHPAGGVLIGHGVMRAGEDDFVHAAAAQLGEAVAGGGLRGAHGGCRWVPPEHPRRGEYDDQRGNRNGGTRSPSWGALGLHGFQGLPELREQLPAAEDGDPDAGQRGRAAQHQRRVEEKQAAGEEESEPAERAARGRRRGGREPRELLGKVEAIE